VRVAPTNQELQEQNHGHMLQQLPTEMPELSSHDSNPQLMAIENHTIDAFYPFFDPEIIDLSPYDDAASMPQFQPPSIDLDYLEIDGWDTATSL
jgi:hypothetical protein